MSQDNTARNQWFFVRDSLEEQPSEAQAANVSESPDIILGKPGDLKKYISEYDQDVSEQVLYNQVNYVFLRAKNLGGDIASGNVSAYLTHTDNLCRPYTWQSLKTANGHETTSIAAAAETVAVNKTPFVWTDPLPPSEPGAPYCLILTVFDETHSVPQPPASVTTKEGFDAWIASISNVAYRELAMPPQPEIIAAFTWEGKINAGNDQEQDITISLSCSKHDAGAEMDFLLEKSDAEGNVISIGKRQLGGPNEVYPTTVPVPAHFSSKVMVNYYLPVSQGKSADVEFTLKVSEQTGSGIIVKEKIIQSFKVTLSQTETIDS